MARLAVGGWQHETNTFAPGTTDYAAFERADTSPALSTGQDLIKATHGVHLPVTGAINALNHLGHKIIPLTWCSAIPGGLVTEDAFERIAYLLCQGLEQADPVDGIYLDLHGAMVCEHTDDGEGELLQRIRDVAGHHVPVSISLDLHANVSDRMVQLASAIEIYRTYPHVDMAATGARAAAHLHRLVSRGERWVHALRHLEFLVPLNWGCTLIEPAKSLYAQVDTELETMVTARSLALGFPLADVAFAGPAVIASGLDASAVADCADAMVEKVSALEAEFRGEILPPAEAVERALVNVDAARWPTLLIDTQDNPGGGGTGDTTGLLRALVEANAVGSVVATICDPAMAQRAHSAGTGSKIDGALGGQRTPGDTPVLGEFRVLRIASGEFTATGPMYHGARMVFGPMALLEYAGIRIVVASTAAQVADQSILRHVGIDPAREPIICLKSSVHFRNDFQKLAADIHIVASPGTVPADPGELTFSKLRSGVRR